MFQLIWQQLNFLKKFLKAHLTYYSDRPVYYEIFAAKQGPILK